MIYFVIAQYGFVLLGHMVLILFVQLLKHLKFDFKNSADTLLSKVTYIWFMVYILLVCAFPRKTIFI